MRIIGVDPGYERLGIGVVEKNNGHEILVFSTCLTTPKTTNLPERLKSLGQQFENLITSYRPGVLAIEKVFFAANKKTAGPVEASRGVILYLAALHQLKIVELTPQQIKNSVAGHGRAPKQQVQKMVEAILKETRDFKNDDEIDAIAAALTVVPMLSTI